MIDDEITIPYYIVYASEYIVFRSKLTTDEIIEVFDAVADVCLFGNNDFKSSNKYQQRFFDKILNDLEKNAKKYISCIENGKKGGRPKKNNNPNETQQKPIGYENDNPDKTQPEPRPNPDETNKIKYNKIEYNIIENNKEIKRIDTLTDPLAEKCFSIYSELCKNLPRLKFERRSKDIRELLSNYLYETENDLEYFKQVCTKANIQKTICDNVIDFKSILKNHIAIYNEKFKKGVDNIGDALKFK